MRENELQKFYAFSLEIIIFSGVCHLIVGKLLRALVCKCALKTLLINLRNFSHVRLAWARKYWIQEMGD